MSRDLNVLALFKGNERFIFVFDDDSLPELQQTVWGLAANPETPVNWHDAAVLVERARQQVNGAR